MKKILITGASGFVGSYLVKELIKNPDVEIYGTYLSDKSLASLTELTSKIKLAKVDLMNARDVLEIIEQIKPDEIYHLAALTSAKVSFENPQEVMVNNIVGQLNIFEAIRKLNLQTRIMIISSAEVYGIVSESDLPIDEDTKLNPANPYAVSKIAQDFMALQYYNSYKLNVLRVRPFNHIGPGQSDQFATSAFAKKIAEIEKGMREPILTVGNLESKRDFTDVKDVIRAYILLMEKGQPGDVYNIGSGKSHKMSEVLDMLLSFSTTPIKVEVDPSLLRPTDNPNLICDNMKISGLTGWQPEIPLEKTLQDILEYWRGFIK